MIRGILPTAPFTRRRAELFAHDLHAGVLFTTVGTFMLTAEPDNPPDRDAQPTSEPGAGDETGGGGMGVGEICGLVRRRRCAIPLSRALANAHMLRV